MMLKTPLPAVNDIEGIKVPSHFPLIVNSNVYIFPEAIVHLNLSKIKL